jgi:hypothetical protein
VPSSSFSLEKSLRKTDPVQVHARLNLTVFGYFNLPSFTLNDRGAMASNELQPLRTPEVAQPMRISRVDETRIAAWDQASNSLAKVREFIDGFH